MNDTTSTTSYDELPYLSYSYPQIQPENLSLVATMHGLNPVDFKRCRVLELGCASGGNIMPLACSYPNAEYVGVDLSSTQIDEGKQVIQALGLKNIRLEAMSVTDLTEQDGVFDYIIAHGLFSWVPDFVRDSILSICQKLLSPRGVALISFNTLPGWYSGRAARDMMMFHTRECQSVAEKAIKARQFIQDLAKNMSPKSAYAMNLQREIAQMSNEDDFYLVHEYLDEENAQFYFHQFMARCGKHGLRYVGDADLSKTLTGMNDYATLQRLIKQMGLLEFEQNRDFLVNRRFRMAVIGHDSTSPQAQPDFERIANLYFSVKLRCEAADLGAARFAFIESKVELTLSDPYATALFHAMVATQGQRFQKKGLLQSALTLLSSPTQEAKKILEQCFMRYMPDLVFSGKVDVWAVGKQHIDSVAHVEKPKATPLMRYQAVHGEFVTNVYHLSVKMGERERRVLALCDGTRTKKDIVNTLNANISMAPEDETFVAGTLQRAAQSELFSA